MSGAPDSLIDSRANTTARSLQGRVLMRYGPCMDPAPLRTVLVADADVAARELLRAALAEMGVRALLAENAAGTLRVLDDEPVDVVVLDPAFPDAGGTDVLAAVRSSWPSLPVILATADAGVTQAVDAVRAGAADFVSKPFVREEAVFAVVKALERVARTVDVPPPPVAGEGIVFGESGAMKEALEVLQRAAPGTATVLVRGESGTGKEVVARALHDQSPRKNAPFVKIDCASLPDQLLESELFGFEKGAFTGAASRKHGWVELADGGTLFLDEIGELTPPLQAKLLRLLQDREIVRLGGNRTIKVDARVVAATHRDLETMVERGEFRQDLFYRLNVVPLWLPPLRARRGDVEVLAAHFAKVAGEANGKPGVRLDESAIRLLRRQRWPGNVRQLQNFLERLIVLSEGDVIDELAVQTELDRQVKFVTESPTTALPRAVPAAGDPSVVLPLTEELKLAEKSALERALRHAGGNRSRAARLLGISRSTFYVKLEEYGLLT